MALTGPISRGSLAYTFAACLIAPAVIAAASIAQAAPDHLNDTTSCPAGELDACYRSDQMRELAETGEQLVTGYLTQIGITGDSLPRLTYIPYGGDTSSQCVDSNGRNTQNDRSYSYCLTDNTVYIGQNTLWDFYQRYGAVGPISGLAHEYGHFLQAVSRVPNPRSASETIRNENQADCISGTFVSYLHGRENTERQRDVDRVEQYLTATASVEAPGRDHGTAEERVDSFELGYRGGLQTCNQFYPATPLTG